MIKASQVASLNGVYLVYHTAERPANPLVLLQFEVGLAERVEISRRSRDERAVSCLVTYFIFV